MCTKDPQCIALKVRLNADAEKTIRNAALSEAETIGGAVKSTALNVEVIRSETDREQRRSDRRN